MGFVQPSTVHQLAESLAVPNLSEDAAKALAPHIDVRLREIIQEACKFARHAKRKRLTTEDVNDALRLRNCEPLYGFGGRDPARFVRAAGHPDLLYVQDLEVAVDKAIERPLPRVPVQVGVVPHWLAIDGVQPNIPENDIVARPKLKRPRVEASNQKQAKQKLEKGAKARGEAQGQAQDTQPPLVVPPVRLVASLELQRVFEEVRSVLAEAGTAEKDAFSGWPSAKPAEEGAAAITASGQDPRGTRQKKVLSLLASDTGLHPLVPALVELVSEQVKACRKQLPQLHLLIEIVRSLLRNTALHLELYVESLLPPLLTCVLTKRLGGGPLEDHWAVREAAAAAVAAVVARFNGQPGNLRQRVVKQLVNAYADPSKSLPCHYGAIMGLASLGRRVVQMLLLPFAAPYLQRLEKAAAAGQAEVQRAEAERVRGVLLSKCATCLYGCMSSSLSRDFLAQLEGPRLPTASRRLDFKAKEKAAKPAASAAALNRRSSVKKAGNARRAGKTGKTLTAAAAKPDAAAVAAASREEEPKEEAKNELEDAWREDAGLGKHLLAVNSIFGDAVQPFAPGLPLSQLLL